MFRIFDPFLHHALKIKEEVEQDFIQNRSQSDYISNYHYDMDAVDSKSSALLTHISVMFVVLSIFLVSADCHDFIRALLAVELIAYLFLALLLLRCIDVMGPPNREIPTGADDVNKIFREEIMLRRSIYQFSVRGVFLLTFFLIPIILAKYSLD